ncbi:MAG: 2-phospho-L-lactate transferase [Dehalococcoidia bacterium]|nr:2-phospho-L-lactate transferase [Dehalococcoidia bacterium]
MITVFAGGVGGAKLVLGFANLLNPEELTVVVNTGDDEEFYGLYVSPDIDTVIYTLAGLSNEATGWGITGESFRTLGRLKEYGMDTWFNLGDLDFATHITRTKLLKDGLSLSEVSQHIAKSVGVQHSVLPMTNDDAKTIVHTADGKMSFQEYFVKNKCEPVVEYLEFGGKKGVLPSGEVSHALKNSTSIIFSPSNPYLSINPILALSGLRGAISNFKGKKIAVSPIVGGKALKGPAAKLLKEMGADVSAVGVAKQYADICDVFVIDSEDAGLASDIEALGMSVAITDTVMNSKLDKVSLAEFILELCE